MSEWWTYGLSDFLMFSPTTYWRLVERYNREVWPLQILMVAVGAMLLWWVAARMPMAARVVPGMLAAIWLWVGWAFHWERYATINWAAQYFAAAFALQAALLLAVAWVGKSAYRNPQSTWVHGVGLAIAATGVLLYPVTGIVAGRPWHQAEVFGLMPEPTALATLGLLLATGLPRSGWLAVIPTLSLFLGIATGWVLRGSA